MNPIQTIRRRLRVTQASLAKELGVTQGNVSHYEQGQEVPPSVAKLLIKFASSLGLVVTYNDIYGEPITVSRLATDPAPGHPGRQPPSTNNILDTVPEHAVIVVAGAAPRVPGASGG
ncbi:helix-turn-helix domain-containing protein [Janthinobacterium sp. HLX7-2]|uniref:helix-turn-helix domain-containing protein n=1 Tax=Janthinobacterium sp. HLX7-2 TaxID=1259331 RepID=UPI003F24DD0A